jgi:hypothetical protein
MRASISAVLWCALLALSACQGDGDGDGTPDAEDCAPEDASVHPGAEEVCDGIDNDCDGEVEVGATDAPTPAMDEAPSGCYCSQASGQTGERGSKSSQSLPPTEAP